MTFRGGKISFRAAWDIEAGFAKFIQGWASKKKKKKKKPRPITYGLFVY